LPLSYGLEIVHFLEPRWADHEFSYASRAAASRGSARIDSEVAKIVSAGTSGNPEGQFATEADLVQTPLFSSTVVWTIASYTLTKPGRSPRKAAAEMEKALDRGLLRQRRCLSGKATRPTRRRQPERGRTVKGPCS
ncbi:hypothetical protein HPB47_026185, partial [Ixodes persulcatus]